MAIYVVKGVSASGKSTRVYVTLLFLKYVFGGEPAFMQNSKGSLIEVGIEIKGLQTVFIGKEYEKAGITRWQGFDAKTNLFGNSEDFSEFLKMNYDKYSFVIEGAGVTQSNRFRPRFLREYCGFTSIFIQYYNFTEAQKEQYLDRIVNRTGCLPKKDTMWQKRKSFEFESLKVEPEFSLIECSNKFYSYDLFDTAVEDFGVKFLKFTGLPELVPDFLEFVETLDIISYNSCAQ